MGDMALGPVIIQRAVRRQIAVVIRSIRQAGGGERFQIGFALAVVRRFQGPLEGREAHECEDGNNRDHGQNLNHREAVGTC